MLINIEKEALDGIVHDGVKEMMMQVGGRNQSAKKRDWFKAVKAALDNYDHRILNEFLPVLVEDFSKSLVVKFSGAKMSEEDINKVKKFMEMVSKSNIRRFEEELIQKVENLKGSNMELNERLEDVKKVFVDGHQWIFRRVELHVRSVISDAMYKNTVQRSNIEVMLYNFVEGDVPENVKNLFKYGMDSVSNTRLTKKDIDIRVEEALVEYCLRLGRRSICGTAVSHARDVQDWIRQVKILNLDHDSREFIDILENTYPALKAELDLVYHDVKIDSREQLIRKMEKEGTVLVTCDKNMGMSLFTLETMRKADEALMNQLGAVRIEKTKDEIIKDVTAEIENFELGLTGEQKEYLDAAYQSREEDMKRVKFPFLKSLHKIHKMSEKEIRDKDLKALKFRPVVDAKLWLTRGYAGVVMKMMRQACNILVTNGGAVIGKMKVKDGWRFAVDIRDYLVKEEYDIMVSADIQEAYTNISDVMIKKAIRTVCRSIGIVEWKIDLMEKLVDLVLGQNFAETSGGLFRFKKVLPMGYKLSGDALDIVALAEEMTVLYHLGGDYAKNIKSRRVKIGELKNYPEEFGDNCVQKESSMPNAVKRFRRYVDDAHAQIAGTEEEVRNAILAIGYMYPESLVVSMNLNIWHSSFLDVYTWKNILSGEVSTVTRRNGEVPVGHVRKGSSHPEKYKLQSLLGEMLRGRRLASDEEMIELSDKCIAHEFESIGYSRREIDDAMEEARKKVEEKYSGMFVKINEDGERRYFSYGGGLVFNKNYKYGEVLMNYIEGIKPKGEPGIMLLPDIKIKRVAFTKKRYLDRQEEDKKKSKS